MNGDLAIVLRISAADIHALATWVSAQADPIEAAAVAKALVVEALDRLDGSAINAAIRRAAAQVQQHSHAQDSSVLELFHQTVSN